MAIIAVVAAETWSVGVYCEATALSNSLPMLRVQVLDSAGNVLYEDWDFLSSVSTSGVASLLKLEGIVIPTGGVTLRTWMVLWATAVDATGTSHHGAVMRHKGATLPTLWSSGRDVRNHFDDNGQNHINYIWVPLVGGEVPALMQLKLSENEAHTKIWAGARQGSQQNDAGLFHEAEDFDPWAFEDADANASGGNVGRNDPGGRYDSLTAQASNATASSLTLTGPNITDKLNQVLIVFTYSDLSTGGARPTGVTHNAKTMTAIAGLGGIRNNVAFDAWYIVNPDTGNNDIVATWAATQDGVAITAQVFSNIDQTTPVRSPAALANTSTDITKAVTSIKVGDIVVAGVVNGAGGGAGAPSNITELQDVAAAGMLFLSGWMRADGTSETVGWTGMNSGDNLIGIVALTTLGQAPGNPLVVTKTISSPPEGTFRVLVRAKRNNTTDQMYAAIGYGYGGINNDPSVAAHYTEITGSAYDIFEIGTLTIPPVEVPLGQTIGPFTLRLAMYAALGGAAPATQPSFDWVFLMPINAGFAYVSKASAQEEIMLDGMSPTRGIYEIDTSDVVQAFPADQWGTPPEAHPDGVRIYFVFANGTDAAIDDGVGVKVVIQLRYLHVRGDD